MSQWFSIFEWNYLNRETYKLCSSFLCSCLFFWPSLLLLLYPKTDRWVTASFLWSPPFPPSVPINSAIGVNCRVGRAQVLDLGRRGLPTLSFDHDRLILTGVRYSGAGLSASHSGGGWRWLVPITAVWFELVLEGWMMRLSWTQETPWPSSDDSPPTCWWSGW